MGAVVLLILGVTSLFIRPARLPLWVGPTVLAVVGLISAVVRWSDVHRSVALLRNPLLFLLFAVPLAVLLDRIGLFEALAAVADGGRHLVVGLWVLAALVTVVFNLDAAVVLLTPLYIRVAARHGLPAEALAFQPALLACLASSPLPVSNLTNLIVAERFHLGVGDFMVHLGLPTVAAVVVGWFAYRLAVPVESIRDGVDAPVEPDALRRGLPIVAFVLVGFTAGDAWGVPAWAVAAAATLWAGVLVREVPWRQVPYQAMLVATALAVLVAGAVPHLGLQTLLRGTGVGGDVRALMFGVVGSDLANNLPAVLAGSASLHTPHQVWPLLIGVNIGPIFVLTGALSGLLWRDTAASFGVRVSARRYSAIGVRVGVPALVASTIAVLLV
jgi:arsenical pump membrane protein